MEWYIGNIKIKNQVVIAPMAGVSNMAFREIVKEFGAGLIYSEMVSDKALIFNNKKTMKMIEVSDSERPMAIQLFGSEVDTLVEAAKIIDTKSDCDIIDINMGCPVNKVVKANAGAKLLLNPDKVFDIVKRIVEAVNKPVTVKIRSGWDKSSINACKVAKMCELAGASAIAIHGRTRTQMYSGHADWELIKEVKKSVSIPVIGNGDIKSVEDAKKMLETTGCDAIMIGRGILGNPWLIEQINDYFETGKYSIQKNYDKIINLLLKHLYSLRDLKGETLAVLEMRTHAAWYIKALPGATHVKRKLSKLSSIEEYVNLFEEYREYLKKKETVL